MPDLMKKTAVTTNNKPSRNKPYPCPQSKIKLVPIISPPPKHFNGKSTYSIEQKKKGGIQMYCQEEQTEIMSNEREILERPLDDMDIFFKMGGDQFKQFTSKNLAYIMFIDAIVINENFSNDHSKAFSMSLNMKFHRS
jgi:hypothetical protein